MRDPMLDKDDTSSLARHSFPAPTGPRFERAPLKRMRADSSDYRDWDLGPRESEGGLSYDE